MQQLQQVFQHKQQHSLHGFLAFAFFAQQAGLAQLNIPVTEFAPGEIIDLRGSQAEVAVLHMLGDILHCLLQPGQDPLVRSLQLRGIKGFPLVYVHQYKAAGVPHLVGKVPGSLHLVLAVAGIIAGAHAHYQAEAQRVGTVFVNNLQRIYAVAQGFGHLPSLFIPHQAVDQHRLKGCLTHVLDTGNHHPGNPESNNIPARHQHAGGIEVFQIFRVVRPSQGGERPQGGGEPGIKHVLILAQLAAALRADCRILAAYDLFTAVIAVPHRNPVSPPQLAADAPVADVLHPVIIHFAEPFRHKLRPALPHSGDSRFSQGLHLHKPLFAQPRFHRRIPVAVAEAHVMAVVFNLHQQTQLFQFFNNGLPALHGIHAGKASGILVHGAVVVGHRDNLQVVPLGHFKVVRVMGGSHLHRAGAELFFHIIIRDHWNFLVHDGQDHFLSHQVRIPFIGGVHGHAGITQHGFRPGSGHHDAFASVGAGITDMPQVAGHILVFHFRVTDGALAGGAPVDHPVSAVDQALFIQPDKHLTHRAAAAFVHGEAFPAPVAADTHLPLLVHDTSAVFFFPVPGALQESFPADSFFGQAFFPHGFHNPDLCRDGGMVSTGQPQGGITLHPVIADRGILHDAVHGMAHMQLAGNIGRRHNDGEWFLSLNPVRGKRAGFFPGFIDVSFNLLWIEPCRHIGAAHFLLHGNPPSFP